MTNRWLLPDHISDILPAQARQIESTRRALLDAAQSYGFELVIPPLVEHLDSLLVGVDAGTDSTLDLQTFKLVDQHSGRSLGVRADITPQVARIDAHLLNREGVARLCYCGSVLHTRQATAHASREPLQFGAEIYGHAGPESDLEVMALTLHSLAIGGINGAVLDLADVRIATSLFTQFAVSATLEASIYEALATKDASAIQTMPQLDAALRSALLELISLHGGRSTLLAARAQLPRLASIAEALDGLEWLADQLVAMGVAADHIRFDLADLGGYGYYSGVRFAAYSPSAKDALARGGRYDNVGEVFGRKRAAVGFSLDIKVLVDAASPVADVSISGSVDTPFRGVGTGLAHLFKF